MVRSSIVSVTSAFVFAFSPITLVAQSKPATIKSKPAPAKAPTKAALSTLQEGWYKVTVGKIHSGYFIQRVEYDSKAKQFIATTFLKTGSLGGNITESLKAYSDESLKPVSYQYTYLADNGNKTIDATFQGWVGTFTTTAAGKTTTEQKKFREGTLLSSVLTYLIMRAKEGLKVGNNYVYSAIAEEQANALNGKAWVKEETQFQGETAYRVFNDFGKDKYVLTLSSTGKLLAGKSPEASLEYSIVGSREEAVGSVAVNDKTLQLLFGSTPAIEKSQKAPVPTAEAPVESESAPVQPKLKDMKPKGEESSSSVPPGLSVPPGKGQ